MDDDTMTLFTEIESNNINNFISLVQSGADVNEWEWERGTPLHYAVCHGRYDMVEILLRSGVDIEGEAHGAGDTAVAAAASANEIEIMKLLLAAGANPNVTDTDTESTPLILAAGRSNSIQVMQMLLDAGADLDGQDPDGRTALWWATFSGRKENANFLIQAGADKNLDYDKDLGY